MAHAFLSPSGAPAWLRCEAKVHMEVGLPDKSGKDAAEGTAAHALRAMCLTEGTDARGYLGRIIEGFEVTDEMADAVQRSVDVIRSILANHDGAELHVEVPLDISHITGEPGAQGTSDTVILLHSARTLIVDDYKHGRGVPVDAEDNEQLVIYAGAALQEFDLVGDWQHITMRISQPRINNDSEWTITRDELLARLEVIGTTARRIWNGTADTLPAVPGEKQCRFCKVKATCPALAAKVQAEVGSDFESLTSFDPALTEAAMKKHDSKTADQLGAALAAVDLIETWCKAVRAESERRLLAGQDVPGFKLVEGRRGARKWADEQAAEEALKAMRIKHDQMYDYSVISPTSAEKLAKSEVIGPRQWPKLQALITQAEGKPSVVPVSDRRPALVVTPLADEFDDVTVEGLV